MKKILTVIMIGLLCLSTYSILAPRLRAESEVLQLPAGAYYANHGQTYATTLQNINVANQGQIATVAPGQTITIAYTLQIFCNMGPPPVPGEIRQAFFGYSWASSWPPWDAYTEVYNGIPGLYPGVTKSDSFTLQVPTSLGSYSVWFLGESQYSMQDAIAAHTSPPAALPHAIIVVTTANRPSPVGYWKFDEGTGSIAHDSSGNSHYGTLYGASWTTGISESALRFDGIDDYVEVPNSADMNPSTITLMAWVRFNSFPDFATHPGNPDSDIICKGTFISNGYELRQDCGDTYEYGPPEFRFCILENNVWYSVVSTTKLGVNEWYHVAATYDGSNLSLYVNGRLEDRKQCTVALLEDGNIRMGALGQPSYFYIDGTIDEVKIYNYARTAEEILSDYQSVQVTLPWRDDFNYNSVDEMKTAGWNLGGGESLTTVGSGVVTLDNNGAVGVSIYFDGRFPSGITDFKVETRGMWVGRSYDTLQIVAKTTRHVYLWSADGYYSMYYFARDEVKSPFVDGYTPQMNTWMTLAIEKRGNTFYMYYNGELKNTYVEADATPDALLGVGIRSGWVSTTEYDYISVIAPATEQPDFEISVPAVQQNQVADPKSPITYTVTVESLAGFNQPVTLSTVFDSHELAGTFAEPTVSPPANEEITTTLSVSVLSEELVTHQIYIIGTSGTVSHTEQVSLRVPFMSVPYLYQGDTGWCFPTSVAMVMGFFGENVNPWEVAIALHQGHDDGFTDTVENLNTLKFYVEGKGLLYDPIAGAQAAPTENELQSKLSQNEPIVLTVMPFGDLKQAHTVALTGYVDDNFYVNDPAGGLLDSIHVPRTSNIQVAVGWSDLQNYLTKEAYAIAINGNPSIKTGRITLVGGGNSADDYLHTVIVTHGDSTGTDALYVWETGYLQDSSQGSPGLNWNNTSPSGHSKSLDILDYFVISRQDAELVSNPTDTDREYRFDVIFSSASYVKSTPVDIFSVSACQIEPHESEPIGINNLLGNHYGIYTISLRLFSADSSLLDTVDLPPIEYKAPVFLSGNGHVTLTGGDNVVIITGGNDVIDATRATATTVIKTGAGNDVINLGGGNNIVTETAGGNDIITTGNGNNTITITGNGNYQITTGSGNDQIQITGDGNNIIKAGNGDNMVTVSGKGNNQITTGSGNDVVLAGNGNNIIKTGAGNDSITVGNGNNNIDGGAGYDVCIHGTGHNTFLNCEKT